LKLLQYAIAPAARIRIGASNRHGVDLRRGEFALAAALALTVSVVACAITPGDSKPSRDFLAARPVVG
jgi:hypothetical protein